VAGVKSNPGTKGSVLPLFWSVQNTRSGHVNRPVNHPDLMFIRRVLIVIALGALTLAAWVLADIMLLLFGAVLVAVLLRALANPMMRHLHMPERLALTVAVLLPILLMAAVAITLGPELSKQMRGLLERLPAAFNRLTGELQLGSFIDLLKSSGATSTLGNMVSRAFAWSTSVLGAMASIALVIFGGIYLAADPAIYRDGLIKLFPPAVHANVTSTLDDIGDALQAWLRGQLVAMVLVGAMTGVGLWLIGVPNAIALGLIVGLADFVPYIGPIAATIPILLSASTQDTQTLLWACIVIVAVQQIESNIIMPLVAKQAVSMAPVVGLFSLVALGVLFGPLGLLLGFPLAIAIDIAIRRLYILDGLGEPVEIMGEPAERSEVKSV
jgi:predicted PurR-regulated permease PerM